MARNGSNIYSKPAGTTAVSGTTIESAKYNEVIDDIAADLNLVRPVVAGGTGVSTIPAFLAAYNLEIGTDVQAWNAVLEELTGAEEVPKRHLLGSTPIVIGDAGVIDNSLVPGIYSYATSSGSTNGPATVTQAIIVHHRRAVGGGEAQVCLPDAPTTLQGKVYVRARTTGAWSVWRVALNDDDLLDEDDMATNSANKVPSQQSVKAYVDAQVAALTTFAVSVTFNGTGTPAVISGSGVSAITDNGTGDYTLTFDPVLPNADYQVFLSCSGVNVATAGDANRIIAQVKTDASGVVTKTGTQLRITTNLGAAAALTDVDEIYVGIVA